MNRVRPAPLLFLLVAVVYAGSLTNGFHLDDFHSVVNNPHLDDLRRVPSFFADPAAFSVNPESAMYRPLLLTTFAVDRAVFGTRAAGYHAVSLVLHAGVVVAGLAWLLALGVPRRVATTAALLFAVHPVNSEAVCYVSSRSEVLMALCLLCAATWASRYRETGRPAWLAGAAAAAAGSLLTKSVAVIAPGVLVLGDWFAGGWQRLRGGWRGPAAFLLLAAGYVVYVRGAAARALVDAPVRSLAAQFWTQAKAHAFYLRLTSFPVRLNVEHQFDVSRGPEAAAVAAVLLLASLAGTAWALRRRLRWPAFAAGWWALSLLPATVVPLIVLVNEHRLYLASFAVVLPAAVCLGRLRHGPGGARMAVVGVAAYTIVFAVLTMERTRDWRSEATLWAAAADAAPSMVRPHLRLADALAAAGQAEAAEVQYLRALALRPAHVASRNNLGLLYRGLGRLDEAAAQFRSLLAVSPDNVAARLNLAELLLLRGRWREASAQYDTALTFGDTRGRAQVRRGQIALRFGHDPAAALAQFDAAIAVAPDDVDARVGRGVALRQLGRTDEALAAYHAAAGLDRRRADIWYNIGNLLLDRGDGAQALDAFRRVIDIGSDTDLTQAAADRIRGLEPTDTETDH